jgi:RNA polymerase sigma-70 factor (ECF subfamily)
MASKRSTSNETESVVDSVRRGNLPEVETLFSAHRKYIRHVVGLRMDAALRRRIDPSDIVQEAFVEAMRRANEYARDPKLPVRLWLRQLAIDRLIMSHRQHVGAGKRSTKREFALPDQSSLLLAEQLVAPTRSPSKHAARKEMIAKVRDAVANLSESDREIILLQAFEGLNSTESGQILGIEPATARKRFGRALLRVRQRLIESGLRGSTS